MRRRILSKIILALIVAFSFGDDSDTAEAPRKPAKAAWSWSKVSDQQIARMLFPKEKLYLYPKNIEALPSPNPAIIDGVAILAMKRVVANFDNDPDEELAVVVHVYTGLCTFCNSQAVFAILHKDDEKIRVAWRSEEGSRFFDQGTEIATIKLIKMDKFFELKCIFDGSPMETGTIYREMEIIRWNGQKFTSIWSYELEGYGTGARGVMPHDYLASVDFIDAKDAKRIKATSLLTTRPNPYEVRQHFKLEEEFAWNEKVQAYQPTKQYELSYELGKTCVASKKTQRYLGEPGLQQRGPEERSCQPWGGAPQQ
jgi:hypothetical protein